MWNTSLKKVTIALGFSYQGKDIRPHRMVFDSREIQPGDLFIAIVGEKVDGHRFIEQARTSGAAGVVISDVSYAANDDFPTIIAPSGEAFIEAYGRYARQRFQGAVVAITGSQGKTSTKELLASVLRHAGKESVVTFENQNNELGLPLTLSRITESTECVVVEMGMTGFSEIAHLCDIAQPHFGILTNIGTVHAELLGSREGIARAKTELFAYLPSDGLCALRDKDAEMLAPFLSELRAEYAWCGLENRDNTWYADGVREEAEKVFFTLHHHGQTWESFLPIAGKHMVENALLVIAIANALHIEVPTILEGLKKATITASHRMEKHVYQDDVVIIDDSYNANPESMCATLHVLQGYQPARTIAILGDMYELGDYAEESFQRVGETVHRLGIDYILCYGNLARAIGKIAEHLGVEPSHIAYANDYEKAAQSIASWVVPKTVIFLKGSHSLELHKLIQYIEAVKALKK